MLGLHRVPSNPKHSKPPKWRLSCSFRIRWISTLSLYVYSRWLKFPRRTTSMLDCQLKIWSSCCEFSSNFYFYFSKIMSSASIARWSISNACIYTSKQNGGNRPHRKWQSAAIVYSVLKQRNDGLQSGFVRSVLFQVTSNCLPWCGIFATQHLMY